MTRKGAKQGASRQVVPQQYATLWGLAKGNREVNWGLVAPIREVLDSLGRPPGQRRVTYNLLDNYQDNPTVANLIARGNRLHNDPKSELGNFVAGTLATMRDIGLVHPNEVADNRAVIIEPDVSESADEYIDQLREDAENGYRHDRLAGQPQRIEIWTEAADTIPDLTALGDRYGVPVGSASGSIGFDPVVRLGRRMARDAWMDEERPADVLYLGDFDPPGLSISDTIKHAAIQASRWYRSWELQYRNRKAGMTPTEAWAAAAAEFPNGAEPLDWAYVDVIRLGVVQADLDGRPTSPVKKREIEKQYRADGSYVHGSGHYERWWPRGETRTLQLEGLPVDEVVARVEAALIERTDREALDEVLDTEADSRAEVMERLGQ